MNTCALRKVLGPLEEKQHRPSTSLNTENEVINHYWIIFDLSKNVMLMFVMAAKVTFFLYASKTTGWQLHRSPEFFTSFKFCCHVSSDWK